MFEAIALNFNLHWVYWALAVVYVLTVIGIIAVILSENRNPVKSLAWVTVLILLPVMGMVLYLFFGRSIKNKRMISRRNRRKLRKRSPASSVDIAKFPVSRESKQQIELARSLTGAQFYVSDTMDLYLSGEEKFKALLEDIHNARHFIHLQYYILEDDMIGTTVRDALIERARAGVIVRVIYDPVGSFGVKKRFYREMKNAGIQVYPFFKVSFPQFATRINWRNHRKLVVIDGHIGYIGGMNIADRYVSGDRKSRPWRDTHVRITGQAVNALEFSFAVDWNFMGLPLIDDSRPSERTAPKISNALIGMQVLTSGPTSQWSNIAFVLFKAIANAKQRVYIQTPYFLPTESLLRALQTAALAHVDVRIMLPRKNDSRLLRNASFSYIMECLRAGIKIYLYEESMLHSKTMVVDSEFATVGSTNFDFRSFEHNFEGNLFVYSAEINTRMAEMFLADQTKCTRVTASAWRRRPLKQKVEESIVRLLSPIL